MGSYFQRLLGTSSFTSWHDLRIGGTYGADPADCAAQQDAAKKTEAHAATPAVAHFDALGRTCLGIADNGGGNRYPTRTAHDLDGRTLAIIDAAGRRAMEYCLRTVAVPYVLGYDLTGTPLYTNGLDSGAPAAWQYRR